MPPDLSPPLSILHLAPLPPPRPQKVTHGHGYVEGYNDAYTDSSLGLSSPSTPLASPSLATGTPPRRALSRYSLSSNSLLSSASAATEQTIRTQWTATPGTPGTPGTPRSPPPSAFHRRQRSSELLSGLTVLAAGPAVGEKDSLSLSLKDRDRRRTPEREKQKQREKERELEKAIPAWLEHQQEQHRQEAMDSRMNSAYRGEQYHQGGYNPQQQQGYGQGQGHAPPPPPHAYQQGQSQYPHPQQVQQQQAQQPPAPPPKKPGFFRRLSLSTSTQQSAVVQPHPQAAAAAAARSGGGDTNGHGYAGQEQGGGKRSASTSAGRKKGDVAGTAYEALPPGAAPSSFRAPGESAVKEGKAEKVGRSKSRERGFFGRVKDRDASQSSTPSGTPPPPAAQPTAQTPIAASFTRPPAPSAFTQQALPQLDSFLAREAGPYPGLASQTRQGGYGAAAQQGQQYQAGPGQYQQGQQQYQQGQGQRQGQYTSPTQAHPPNQHYPQHLQQLPAHSPHSAERPRKPHPHAQPQPHTQPPQPQPKHSRSPSHQHRERERARIHPALASPPSSPPEERRERRTSFSSPYGVEQHPGELYGKPGAVTLGQEVAVGSLGEGTGGPRNLWPKGGDHHHPAPINPAPRSSSRNYGDLRSPPPPKDLGSPPPPMPAGMPQIPQAQVQAQGQVQAQQRQVTPKSGRPQPALLVIPGPGDERAHAHGHGHGHGHGQERRRESKDRGRATGNPVSGMFDDAILPGEHAPGHHALGGVVAPALPPGAASAKTSPRAARRSLSQNPPHPSPPRAEPIPTSSTPKPTPPRPSLPAAPAKSTPTVPTRSPVGVPPVPLTAQVSPALGPRGERGMSEASKYARAVAATMRHEAEGRSPAMAPGVPSPVTSPVSASGSPRRRPLPQPPGSAKKEGRGSMVIIASSKEGERPSMDSMRARDVGGSPRMKERAVEKSLGERVKDLSLEERGPRVSGERETRISGGERERKISGKELTVEQKPAEAPAYFSLGPADAPAPLEKDREAPSEATTPKPRVLPKNLTVTTGEPPVDKRLSQQPINFEFPRSPTLPPLLDPRKASSNTSSPLASPGITPMPGDARGHEGETDPISRWTGGNTPPLSGQQLPVRGSSAQGKRSVSSPLSGRASPMVTSPLGISPQGQFPPGVHPGPRTVSMPMDSAGGPQYLPPLPTHEPLPPPTPRGPRPVATLSFILAFSGVQAALLPYFNINMFLSLTGASEHVRRRFGGEMVGRWVMREWGLVVGRERGGPVGGVPWPNMRVWEGMLESLLHDPASYSTYPDQWHALLGHLCLSHTLIVLHLRSLPSNIFPNPPPLPFEDESALVAPHMPFSSSANSLTSSQGRPRSRVNSVVGSDSASLAPGVGKMPKKERVVEIVMPEPLAAQPKPESPVTGRGFPPPSMGNPHNAKLRRRGSVTSLASVASMPFARKRTTSTTASIHDMPMNVSAAPMPSGKATLPPVSYPSAKRYAFKRHGEPSRSRTTSESGAGRPGSIFSVQSSPSMSFSMAQSVGGGRMWSAASSRASFAVDRNAPPVPGFPAGLPMPPPIGGGPRASFSSSEMGRSSRRSEYAGSGGGNSPSDALGRRDLNTPSPAGLRIEQAFDKPVPYTPGRVPLLRVFVPLSERVPRWPSAEGAAATAKELDRCGALRRMKLGDLVINTAIRQPKTTEHVLIYVPYSTHLLLPLSYVFNPAGHLPASINAFHLPPSYYYPFLPTPQVVYLDLAPYGAQAMASLRLAYDRRDVVVASGARVSAKRYLHVAGFAIGIPGDGTGADSSTAVEWQGMVSLEGEGTAEGKKEMELRLVGDGRGGRPVVGAWEVVREKCMVGNVWLRLVREGQQ